MIKKYWKLLIITSLVTLLPMVAGLILWNQLPEQLPAHWNMAGEVDDWMGKGVFVFGMPVFMVAIQWLAVSVSGSDPKNKNISDKVMQMILWLIPVLNIVLCTITYLTVAELPVSVDIVMPIFMGLLFVIIGNYLPKCKQSYTVGIKVPWTLNSEENWYRTHRFAGILWVIGGFLGMATAFVGGFVAFMVIMALMTVAPVVYSYVLYRKGI